MGRLDYGPTAIKWLPLDITTWVSSSPLPHTACLVLMTLFFCNRFGRSTLPVVPPAQPSFLQRYSASQPAALTADDLMTFLRAYEEDYSSPVSKKSASFVRFGRDPSFIRFGRSVDEENSGYQAETNTYPQRRHRARNHFIRLGRDNELSESNDEDRYEVESERTKRSVVDPCNDCA